MTPISNFVLRTNAVMLYSTILSASRTTNRWEDNIKMIIKEMG